jgi:hypothetical protein
MGEPLYYKFVAYKVCRDNVEFSEICRLHKKLGA